MNIPHDYPTCPLKNCIKCQDIDDSLYEKQLAEELAEHKANRCYECGAVNNPNCENH